MIDKLKIIAALAFVAAGIAGFYYLSESATIYRLLALAAGILVGCAVAWFTQVGRNFFTFAQESWAETKKVVWPSRKETLQTTAVVFGFVIIMAAFLWLTDKSLEVALYDWILGQGWTKS
jgi:preprotein translocase subunit SecE